MSNFYSPASREQLTHDLREEACAATTTASLRLHVIYVFLICCPISLALPRPPRPPRSLAMNVHPNEVLNNLLCDTREATHYITASVFFNLETVHLQIEEIRQKIQDANSNYLFNILTPNTNILYTADETINYTDELLQDHHSYPGPPSTPISQFYSLAAQEHLTPDLIVEDVEPITI